MTSTKHQVKYPVPKFKVGDTIWMKDEFHFNPAEKTISIGKITAIHLHMGRPLFHNRPSKYRRFTGRITYHVSGFNLIPDEHEIQLYKGELSYDLDKFSH